ncbi:MAG TPA: peroxiredoxin [Paludibacteraceae bacterium]|nr:peroxiredoxin [Paludibacteraceae bacterium]
MKPRLFLTLALILTGLVANAQTVSKNPISLGMNAPEFKSLSTQGEINFPADYYNKWKVLFSHPADFTPVCTSEIIALADKQEEFKYLNAALIVISTDGLNSHIEWVKSMEGITRTGKSAIKINFPLVADADLTVVKKYNMMHQDSTNRESVRSVVVIDPDNKVRAFFVYPDNIGRNIDEILRTLKALQMADKDNVLTPANWQIGKDVLIHAPKSMKESEKLKLQNNPNMYSLTWYMWYKKDQ